MLIGFDGKRAVKNMTGLGNYSRLVIEEMARRYSDDRFYLYTPELTSRQRENPRLAPLLNLENVEFRFPFGLGPLSRGALWRSLGISRHFRPDGLDLYHGLSNELPLNILSAGVPSVVTIHDLIYLRLPQCYSAPDRFLYNYKYGRSARNATRVIAISQCTKRDLVELQGVDESKIDVVYQGCDPSFRKVWKDDRLEDLRNRYGLPSRFLLQVGTIEMRKNLELSVRSLSAIDPAVNLVVVGRDRLGYKQKVVRIAEQLGVASRLIFLESLPFADLPGLNQAAEVVLYPSRYEGFGIPVIEALESRTPVVAATGSCLEEAGGGGALYVDPDDAAGMALAVNSLLSDGSNQNADRRAGLVGAGLTHAAKFNPDAMTSSIEATYYKAIQTTKMRG